MPPEFGRCALCQRVARLTREHIPARALGNNGAVAAFGLRERFDRRPVLPKVHRDGITYTALCQACNRQTGLKYVGKMRDFVDRCRTALSHDFKTEDQTASLVEPEVRPVRFVVDPLAIVKYTALTMLVTAGVEWASAQPELRAFVLDPRKKGPPSGYRFYVALLHGPLGRFTGIANEFRIDDPRRRIELGEVSFPPVSLQMTHGEPANEQRLPGEITDLGGGDYRYKELRSITLNLSTGFVPPSSPVPGALSTPARDAHLIADALERPPGATW